MITWFTTVAVVVAAAAEGVTLLPGHRFFPTGGGERHLRLPFTAPVELLTEAVIRLRRRADTRRLDAMLADFPGWSCQIPPGP